MKLYVVIRAGYQNITDTGTDLGESTELFGVFSSQEKAEAALPRAGWGSKEADILICELDVPTSQSIL